MKEKVIQKRFQFFSKDGIKWSSWFKYNGNNFDKIQFKSNKTILLNKYRNIDINNK